MMAQVSNAAVVVAWVVVVNGVVAVVPVAFANAVVVEDLEMVEVLEHILDLQTVAAAGIGVVVAVVVEIQSAGCSYCSSVVYNFHTLMHGHQ